MGVLNDVARVGLVARAEWLEREGARLVIDADTHVTNCSNLPPPIDERYRSTPAYYHGRPVDAQGLLAEMELAGVDAALVWQNPAATLYRDDPVYNAGALRRANEYVAECARHYPTRFIPAGWTDPKNLGLERALELVDWCVLEAGFSIVKLNPAQNAFPIDSDVVVAVVERIVALGAVAAFHYGADTPYTPAAGLERIARRFSPSPVIAIHMGGGGAGFVEAEEQYQQTRCMGLQNPNVVFLLSARRDTHSESDIIAFHAAGEPYRHNLCCASDAPYGRMTFNFGGFGAMLRSLTKREVHPDPRIRSGQVRFSAQDVQSYLGGNFARHVARSCRSVLAGNK